MGYKRGSEPVVALAKSPSAVYETVDFPGLLLQAVELLESAGVTMPRSGSVFIKPNLVIPATAKESITTEPRFIAALIRLLLENGVDKVYVGESAASFILAEQALQISGMGEAVLQAGGTIVNIDDPSERVTLDMPGSDIVERISVPRKAWEVDCLINFGKVKTHRVGSFTCCVKNWVGLIDQQTRLDHHQSRLPKLVAELHRLLPEDICFGDGVIVGEGDGPDLCRPRYLGALLASNDPVALDVIGAELLGMHRHDLVFPWTAYFEGVGEIDPNRIRLLGAHPQEIAIQIEKPLEVMYHRFPCNIVLGGMCEGCFAWFMGPALFWERDGIWEKINANVGRPTMMLGFNAVDRNFEKHLSEGPYFVIGDCTPTRFQQDPRVVFIPGCCPGPRIPEIILKTCKVTSEDV
jgi:uncharacterized protein (DUF362 family)